MEQENIFLSSPFFYASTSKLDVVPATVAVNLASGETDHNQRHADRDVENVVDTCPFEQSLGKQAEIAGHGLIEVNQAESDVEDLDRRQVIAHNDDRADHTEGYVENVVRGGAAGRTFMRGDNKSEKSNENQRRGKYRQNEKVQVIENHLGDPFSEFSTRLRIIKN
jgi:hypothetical protein